MGEDEAEEFHREGVHCGVRGRVGCSNIGCIIAALMSFHGCGVLCGCGEVEALMDDGPKGST